MGKCGCVRRLVVVGVGVKKTKPAKAWGGDPGVIKSLIRLSNIEIKKFMLLGGAARGLSNHKATKKICSQRYSRYRVDSIQTRAGVLIRGGQYKTE